MQPVIVRVRRSKAVMRGVMSALFAFLGLAFTLFLMSASEPNLWLVFISALIVLMLAGVALFFFGIALHAPIALRMDRNGVSGFFANPATWDEIKDVGLVTGRKSHRFLGFALHDPIAFRDRQSTWRRFASWLNGRASGYHIIVPEVLLHKASVDDLVAEAQRFRRDNTTAHDEVT